MSSKKKEKASTKGTAAPIAGTIGAAKVPIAPQGNRYKEKVFTIDDLRFDAKLEQEQANQSYEKIYDKVIKNIRRTDMEGSASLSYQIPEAMQGVKKYSSDSCALYVLGKIRQGGFTAYLDSKTLTLMVTWQNARKEHQMEITKSLIRENYLAKSALNIS